MVNAGKRGVKESGNKQTTVELNCDAVLRPAQELKQFHDDDDDDDGMCRYIYITFLTISVS